jgi:hypothetical protein
MTKGRASRAQLVRVWSSIAEAQYIMMLGQSSPSLYSVLLAARRSFEVYREAWIYRNYLQGASCWQSLRNRLENTIRKTNDHIIG